MVQNIQNMEYKFETEKWCFIVSYQNKEATLQSHNYDTVWMLKEAIYDEFKVPPSNQIIEGWLVQPEDSNDTLAKCSKNRSQLRLFHKDDLNNGQSIRVEEDEYELKMNYLELSSSFEFNEYFTNNFHIQGVTFHSCLLENAISEACFTTRKALLLYFHNKNDQFAKIFATNLNIPKVQEVLKDTFFLLGWDIENEKKHPGLIAALNKRPELTVLCKFIKTKTCVALIIVPVGKSFILHSCIRGDISGKDFCETLVQSANFLKSENKIEGDLKDDGNGIGSVEIQQMMLNQLGDRDYDSFEHDEHDALKSKIAFALFGPPVPPKGKELESFEGNTVEAVLKLYSEKQHKQIKHLYEVIMTENNLYSQWKDRVVISFITNCIEPLPGEKAKRAKKYPDYAPHTDVMPVPLFIIRKCENSEKPCRIIIDDTGRVYNSWIGFLTDNKLHECLMVLPKNGRYEADKNGDVQLERHLSPACGIGKKILKGVDYTSTGIGLVSGGVFVAASISTITVAPIVLTVAGLAGLGVGIYSLGRSIGTLVDRNVHKQTLSFANSEARGAYFNIVAGTLGFMGAGANVAISQLAARGTNIGTGVTSAANLLNVVNLGASGAGLGNSIYDIVDQWINEGQAPTSLQILQLSSSILFFGHAVYSFKGAGTLVEEAQTQRLQDYKDSLRSNRHRKTFNKLTKETIRQNDGNVVQGRAEVIKAISNIKNKDEVFATLTRMNKNMNRNNVRFSAANGDISLNGINVDLGILNAMDKTEVITFLRNLGPTPEPSQADIKTIGSDISKKIPGLTTIKYVELAATIVKLIGNPDQTVREKIIEAIQTLIRFVLPKFPNLPQLLESTIPGYNNYIYYVRIVLRMFQSHVDEIEKKFHKWYNSGEGSSEDISYYVKWSVDKSKRAVEIFEYVCNVVLIGDKIEEELTLYVATSIADIFLTNEKDTRRTEERKKHGTERPKLRCDDCGGFYYNGKS